MANKSESKKYHFIYKTTNLLNGKYYIGMHSTNNLNDDYLGSGTYFRRSVKKHGKKNFKLEILEILPDRKQLAKREQEIVTLDEITKKECMNLKLGGEGGNTGKNGEHLGGDKFKAANEYWLRNPDKRIEQTSNAGKTTWLSKTESEQQLTLQRLNFKNKKHTKKIKVQIGLSNSIKQKGSENSQYGTMWITNGTENKKVKKESVIPEGWNKGRK